jgi:NADH-quinone oxidoreductase subunit J
VQVIVYAGAIMVLFVFVIMLLNAGEEERLSKSTLAKNLGLPLVVMLAGLLVSLIYRIYPPDAGVHFGDFPGQTADIGRRLYLYYMLPFEVVSILILVAIVGAVVLAKKEV